MLLQMAFLLAGLEASTTAPTVFAPGVISAPVAVTAPTFTPDGATVIFQQNVGDRRTLMTSRRTAEGDWGAPTPLVIPGAGDWFYIEPALSPDGRFLLAASNRAPDGAKPLDGDWGNKPHPGRGGAIWRIYRTATGWSEPRPLSSEVNVGVSVFEPALAANGALYFMRTGEDHRFHLYRAAAQGDDYTAAVQLPFSKLGVTDFDPAVAPDESYVVFGSSRSGAVSQLYISFRTGKSWSEPELLPHEINTGRDIIEPHLSPDGHALYYTQDGLIWTTSMEAVTRKLRPGAKAMAGAPATATAPVTAIVGATLVDVSHGGRTRADIADAVVLVRAGRIAAVGERRRVPVPRGARVIRAEGRFLIPGLIDGYGAMRNPRFAQAYLYEGVTTVFVPLGSPGRGVDGEEAVAVAARGPSVITAAPLSGYSADGSMPDVHPWTRHRTEDRPLDDGQLVRAVQAAADAGRRGVIAGFDILPGQLRTVVAAAHRRGMVVGAELALTSYDEAVAAGADVLVRNDKYQLALAGPAAFAAYADDPLGGGGRTASRAICGEGLGPAIAAFGASLGRSRTALMPALAMEATADDAGGPNPWTTPVAAFLIRKDLDDPVDPLTGARPYLEQHPDRRDAIRTCALRKQANEGALHRAGARYLAGSSAPGYGVMPGGGLHEELKLLQHIGLSPREALAAASGNFAETFGWTDRGLVVAGRRADLVLLDADPRRDVAAVDRIAAVMFEGRLIDRVGLLRAAADARR